MPGGALKKTLAKCQRAQLVMVLRLLLALQSRMKQRNELFSVSIKARMLEGFLSLDFKNSRRKLTCTNLYPGINV